jgi:hypothetical protein
MESRIGSDGRNIAKMRWKALCFLRGRRRLLGQRCFLFATAALVLSLAPVLGGAPFGNGSISPVIMCGLRGRGRTGWWMRTYRVSSPIPIGTGTMQEALEQTQRR